jgi:hypothetical protein
MKVFKCQSCSQLLYFENRICENCSRKLGYPPHRSGLSRAPTRPMIRGVFEGGDSLIGTSSVESSW